MSAGLIYAVCLVVCLVGIFAGVDAWGFYGIIGYVAGTTFIVDREL